MAKNKGDKKQQQPAAAPAPQAVPQEIEAEPGFFGSVIKPGQSLVWENEEEQLALQLTSAALGPKVTAGRTTLVVAAKEIDSIALCTLIPEKVEQCALTHVFTPMDGPVTFTNEGVNDIHLTGLIDIEDDGDEEDDHHHGHDHSHDHHHGDSDSDDNSEGVNMMGMDGTYSDSDDDSDEVMVFGGDDDDDSDDSEGDDEEDDSEGRFEVIDERVHGDAGEKKAKKDAEKKVETPAKKDAEKKAETPAKKEATPAKEAKKEDANNKKRAAPADAADASKKAKVASRVYKGVTIEETAIGKGSPIGRGKKASILYRGTLLNGKQFDASQNRKSPFTFRHGVGDVIKGMDIGIEGMRPGGKRKITIPAHLGYGKSGSPPVIPGNSTLVFDIELL